MIVAKVIVDISGSAVDRVFDYLTETEVPLGSRVLVPFGPKIIEGFVIELGAQSALSVTKLKYIIRVLDKFSAISEEMIALAHYLKETAHIRFVDSLRLCIPSQMRGGKVNEIVKQAASINGELEELKLVVSKRSKVQLEALEYISKNPRSLLSDLRSKFGQQPISKLIKSELLVLDDVAKRRVPYSHLEGKTNVHLLTSAQLNAVNTLLSNRTGSFLIHGVTGSGKTEIYLTAISEILRLEKTAIMLVPEISLTPNMLRLFRNRFGDKVAILHSGLSAGERYDEWLRLKRGTATVAIGARSAVFAPIENVGVIVIDEEHDSSYISDSNPRYNTVVVAKFRQKHNNCILVLGSATPSVETFWATKRGEYELITLPERINKKPLPPVEIVDMNRELRNGNKTIFSQALKEKLIKTVNDGNQAIIFLNRRGHSSFVMCNKCGYIAKCSDCDVSLTYHSSDNELKCHYCSRRYKMFDACPDCKSDYLRQGRIGTQQVERFIKQLLPDCRVLRMDMDTTRGKEAHLNIIQSFAKEEYQVLVGTQMIAKGHDFPEVTLVGILDGDQSLFYSDYRSNERTFQLLLQVAGRCGRDSKPGNVVLQTHNPLHFVLQLAANQDYYGFYNREIAIRESTKFPPFAVLARILYTDEDEQACIKTLNAHYEQLVKLSAEYPEMFLFLQRMKSPIKRIEKKHRYQILLRIAIGNTKIIDSVYDIADEKQCKSTTVFVEVNPQSLT